MFCTVKIHPDAAFFFFFDFREINKFLPLDSEAFS